MPFLVDVVLVIVFCVIGRNSHHEGIISAGLFRTLWPFVIGLLVGWALAALLGARGGFADAVARFDARTLWPTGVTIWLSTLIIGMLLRVISGQGIAWTFIGVAATVLALFLLGWRAAWKALS
ncbi:hypothetical protein NRB20_66300 [Nocardia sp. RB20]|uniref:DUF3054 domain-containing protein n=1 Tax=Nocardia macrotermitis TaxID=2585198 RepID=A0A7K0DCJ6_9NOCA|nr:hypothetical protein [Nocardia macrotermitis]